MGRLEVSKPKFHGVRKREVRAEAVRFSLENATALAEELNAELTLNYINNRVQDASLIINKGTSVECFVLLGRWLLKDSNGSFYTLNNDHFHKEFELYSPVE